MSRWLVVLVVSQSMLALADFHEIQPADAPQHELAHDHPGAGVDKSNSSVEVDTATDCSHCCQCHGATPLSLLGKAQVPGPCLASSHFFNTPFLADSRTTLVDLQPPIA